MKFILGKKLNMSQLYKDDGQVVPVTVIKAGPCLVTQLKTDQQHGYQATQLGFGIKKKLKKPQAKQFNQFKDNWQGYPRYLSEFPGQLECSPGDIVDARVFAEGDKVSVTGISKGRGFQGVVKRHGFKGSPASHGHKDQLRMPGSIGATGAAKVFKGTRMPGRMGNDQVTVRNLEVAKVDSDNNLLYLKGAVPGASGGLVKIIADGQMKCLSAKDYLAEKKTDQTPDTTEKAAEQKVKKPEQSAGEQPKPDSKKQESADKAEDFQPRPQEKSASPKEQSTEKAKSEARPETTKPQQPKEQAVEEKKD